MEEKKKMKKYFFLFALIISSLIIPFTSSVWNPTSNITESTTYVPSVLSGGNTNWCGMNYVHNTSTDVNFTSMLKYSSTTCTRGAILWRNQTIIATSTFSGDIAYFNPYLLKNGNSYMFVCDNTPSSYNAHQKNTGVTYPVVNTFGYWNASFNPAIGNFESTTAWCILSINVSKGGGNINLNTPSNNNISYLTSPVFNCSANREGVELKNISFWDNSTGSFLLNQTINVSGFANSTTLTKNFPDGTYNWSCSACDTNGDCDNAIENRKIIIGDFPRFNILSPSSSISSSALTINVSVNDSINNINYCFYNVTRGASTEKENTTFGLSFLPYLNDSFTLSGEATYVLNVFCNDTSGNINTTSFTFTYSITPVGGGDTGGGGGSVIIIGDNSGWIMESSPGQASYNINMPLGTKRKLSIDFENIGETSNEITLSCVDVDGKLCSNVEFNELKFTLPLLKDVKTKKYFTLEIPENLQSGIYSFNIIATDDLGRKGTITVSVGAGSQGILVDTISKLAISTKWGFPYVLIFLPLMIGLLVISTRFLKKSSVKPFLVSLISLGVPFLVIYFI